MTEQIQAPANAETANSNTREPISTPDINNPPASADFQVPEAYKEKGWATKVKSSDDLWKMLDNSQSLIGKKSVVPDFTSLKPEEINTYFEGLRPKEKTAYKFSEHTPEEQRGELAEMFYNSNLSDKQAELLIKQYEAFQEKTIGKMVDKDDFVNRLKTSFGDDYEAKTKPIIEGIRKTLDKQDLEILDKMPNEYLAVIYRMADKYNQSYGAKPETGGGANPTNNAPSSKEDIAKSAKDLRDKIESLKTRAHTQEEKSALVKQLIELTTKQG